MPGAFPAEKITINRATVTILCFWIYLLLFPTIVQAGQIDLGLIEANGLLLQPSPWAVLDARPIREWETGHLPNAHSFSWVDYTSTTKTGIKYRTMSPETIAAALGNMGINEFTPVVIYGDADTSWGGEGWACWVLSWLGHKGPIRLLRGGIQAWEMGNLRVSKTTGNMKTKTSYGVQLRPELNITATSLKTSRGEIVLIDTRSTFEWFWHHLPQAIHIPWDSLYYDNDRRPIPPARYRTLLKEHGVDPNKQVVFYCDGGIRSAYAWMIHQLSGFSNGKNFEGGLEEWNQYAGE